MTMHPVDIGQSMGDVRARAHVTGRAAAPRVVRVRTVDWPERTAFMEHLDTLKRRRGFRHDSALAEAADFSHTTISNWRSGKQRPSITNITKVATALDVDPTDLAARAGIAEGFAQASTPRQLPAELEYLLDQYASADPNRRAELLGRVAWVSEWFDATSTGDARTRRAS